jgi:hypothetical protein
MEIHFFISHWGNEHLSPEQFFRKAKDAGYDGIEYNISLETKNFERIHRLFEKHGLLFIGQQNLNITGTFQEHLHQLKNHLKFIAGFGPVLINSHTGKDYFDLNVNAEIVEAVDQVSKETGIPIVHELHRGRFLYSSSAAKNYFDRFPDLQIAADFSHWCCVSESLLEGQEEIVEEAIKRSKHIHARVGYSQGPQVSHPFAPEHKAALEKHLHWWQKIVAYQKSVGSKSLTFTVEFGPPPYMPTLPFTNQPVIDLWDLNLKMMHFLKEKIAD